MLARLILIAALIALSGCVTELPPNASCHDKWEAYANDQMHGAMLGGLAGGSISGRKLDC